MGMEKRYIGIFGRRNTGKSSLINLLTGQQTAIVSAVPGSTADPVKKAVELAGIGAVVLVDTAGIDDPEESAAQKVRKSQEMVMQVDAAILLIAGNRFEQEEMELIRRFGSLDIPYLMVHNKNDLEPISDTTRSAVRHYSSAETIDISVTRVGDREKVISALQQIVRRGDTVERSLLDDLVKPGDPVLLVTPIDEGAPQKRMILPQSRTIRELLDNRCLCVAVTETELPLFLKWGITPALVITESSVFATVEKVLPPTMPLTSFSILFARLKGDFNAFLKGTPHIARLKDGDKLLILESCTHHASCHDIGRVKIPRMLQAFTGKQLDFTFVSGLSELPSKVDDFSLVIQCGGCMVTRNQLLKRFQLFIRAGVPVTNYGMLFAYLNGIFERATALFNTP